MSYTNYGKCRDLSVIWEFSKLDCLVSSTYLPPSSNPSLCPGATPRSAPPGILVRDGRRFSIIGK